ncbi:MAG: hypothetical protein O3B72_09930, partial [Proteobacteria bacterium]|nr:hypothetical protein [Pseudomonadota bacterium]
DGTLEMIAGLKVALEKEFDGVDLEVKNIFENGNLNDAADDGVYTIPTLVKKLPPPMRQIIGDLQNAGAVLVMLQDTE